MMPWATFTIVSAQAPSAVILVRAERFRPNHATAADNAFQTDAPAGQSDEETATKALAEMGTGTPNGKIWASTSSPTRTTPAPTACSPTTGCPPTRVGTSGSTRCMPPTVGTNDAPMCWRC